MIQGHSTSDDQYRLNIFGADREVFKNMFLFLSSFLLYIF